MLVVNMCVCLYIKLEIYQVSTPSAEMTQHLERERSGISFLFCHLEHTSNAQIIIVYCFILNLQNNFVQCLQVENVGYVRLMIAEHNC